MRRGSRDGGGRTGDRRRGGEGGRTRGVRDGGETDPVAGAAGGDGASRTTTLDATGLVNALPVSSDFDNGTFTGGDPDA